MNNLGTASVAIDRRGPLARLGRWLDALPHPELVFEISPERMAAARWSLGRLEGFAEEPLPPGALRPSPAQPNLADAGAVAAAASKVMERVGGSGHAVALLLPDVVVRIFLLGFETFPRSTAEATPLLRWRLRKSVPFPVEETVLSWTQQRSAEGGLEVVTAVARTSVVREYEQVFEGIGMAPGVVIGATLGALPLVEDGPAVLLAKLGGASLTTAIVDAGRLALYRCTELSAKPDEQALLDEIFPAVAYFRDRAQRNIERVRLAGMEEYGKELRSRLEKELECKVGTLGEDRPGSMHLPEGAGKLIGRQLESLVGWHLNRGA